MIGRSIGIWLTSDLWTREGRVYDLGGGPGAGQLRPVSVFTHALRRTQTDAHTHKEVHTHIKTHTHKETHTHIKKNPHKYTRTNTQHSISAIPS